MENRNNAREGSAAPSSGTAAKPAPIRRIGSTTLGVVLIALGVCLLLHFFWPGFDYLLAVRLSPVFLIVLGGEVLYYANRPEKGRYDFLSILGCLVLMGCVLCVSLIPLVWDYVGPERSAVEERLENQLEEQLYGMLKGGDVSTLEARVSFGSGKAEGKTLANLDGSERIRITVRLTGPYENAGEFAAQCRRVADAVQQLAVSVDGVEFYWDAQQTTAQGQADRSAYLSLESLYQLDWDEAEMATQTEWNEEFEPADEPDDGFAPEDPEPSDLPEEPEAPDDPPQEV